jgi:hypothetical protein
MCVKSVKWDKAPMPVSINGRPLAHIKHQKEYIDGLTTDTMEVATGGDCNGIRESVTNFTYQYCGMCKKWALRLDGKSTEWLDVVAINKKVAELRVEYKMLANVVEG